MSANEHIEELLSGFLDGELTEKELREFELAMSVDATLAMKLEQFRQLGNDLRSVPKRTLGPDFADRVLAAARRESEASDSLVSQEARRAPKLVIDERQGKWWQLVGVMAALAATLLLAAFVFNRFSNRFSAPGEGLAKIPSVETPHDGMSSTEADSKNESFVRNDPSMRKRMSSQAGFAVLTILEIEPSAKAWNENEVSKILNDAGIVWTNPVTVSDEVIGVLNETRSINQGLPKSGSEPIALVMVMANGRKMDKALKRIIEGVDIFPHVIMDIAFDLPGKELCQKLVDAQISVAGGQQAIATPIVAGTFAAGNVVNSGLESVSQFSSAPPAKYLAPSLRQSAQLGNEIGADEEDAISSVLLVIRQPAK